MPNFFTTARTPAVRKKLRQIGGPVGVVASNGFNSASNFLLIVLLARALSADAFGATSLVITGVILAALFIRGLVIEPLIADQVAPRVAVRHIAVGSIIITTSAVAVAAALGSSRIVSIGLGLGAGATVAIDGCRWTLVKQSRQLRAAVIDLVWLVLQVGAALGVSASAETTALSWGLGGVFAVVLASLSIDFSPPGSSTQRFKVRAAWGAENVVAASSGQIAFIVVPLVAGLEAAGSLRGAASLLGFTTVPMAAMHQLGMIRMSAEAHSPRAVVAFATRLSLGVTALVVVLAAPLLVIDAASGARLLGETWKGSRAVLPWFILQKALSVLAFGAMLVTRVLNLSAGVLRDRSIIAIVSVFAGLFGGSLAGAYGAALAIDAVLLVTLIVWIRRIGSALPASFQ